MTDISRDELKAHLSAVEAQVRAALRVIAAESKATQQAHSALRADLSAALIRLQNDVTANATKIEAKVDKTRIALDRVHDTRKITKTLLAALILIFGVVTGIFAGGSWLLIHQYTKTSTVGEVDPAGSILGSLQNLLSDDKDITEGAKSISTSLPPHTEEDTSVIK